MVQQREKVKQTNTAATAQAWHHWCWRHWVAWDLKAWIFLRACVDPHSISASVGQAAEGQLG